MKRLQCGCWLHWDELKPLDWEQREFFPGTLKLFGWRAALTLMSPLLNFIVNFKQRHKTLAFVDAETGEELDVYADHALTCSLMQQKLICDCNHEPGLRSLCCPVHRMSDKS